MQIGSKIEIWACACIVYITIYCLDIWISRRSQCLKHAPYAQKFDSDDFAFLQTLLSCHEAEISVEIDFT